MGTCGICFLCLTYHSVPQFLLSRNNYLVFFYPDPDILKGRDKLFCTMFFTLGLLDVSSWLDGFKGSIFGKKITELRQFLTVCNLLWPGEAHGICPTIVGWVTSISILRNRVTIFLFVSINTFREYLNILCGLSDFFLTTVNIHGWFSPASGIVIKVAEWQYLSFLSC